MIENFKKDVSKELIDFVSSENFNIFKEIMFQLYIAKLLDFQNSKEDAEADKKVLNVYANLPNLLMIMRDEALERKRENLERTSE